ncbi:hypothetical protein AMTRI_Chr01g130220 [Amborella trichopoda]
MAMIEKLSKYDGTEKVDALIYRSLVGSLIYLTNTRPDIVHAVSICSKFMNEPCKLHFVASKRILRYIQGTKKHNIKYIFENNTNLVGFSNSDWVGIIDDRKSTSGYILCQGTKVISWSSRKQNTMALSSTEAESISTTSVVYEAIWLRRILSNLQQKQNASTTIFYDLQQKQNTSTTIFYDNMSAIIMTKNLIFHNRSKHIEIRHHFIRELTEKGEIEPKFINTNDQLTNIFAKTISTEQFIQFRDLMRVTN